MKDDDDDKMVVLPPFDGERMWRRVERTLDLLDEMRGAPEGGPSPSATPSAPPMAVPLAPPATALGPGIVPIAKVTLALWLAGTFLLGAGTGAGAAYAWLAHRRGSGSAPVVARPLSAEQEPSAEQREVGPQVPGVVWTPSNARHARPHPARTAAPVPSSTFYDRARRAGF